MEEMKKKATFIFLLFSISLGNVQNWKSHSAFVLPNKRYEVGLFQSFRYGYSESLEYSTYPLWFFVMPNLALKKSHDKIFGYNIASKWSLYYPSPILNMVSKKGIGGFIDPTLKVPPMLGFSLSLIMSRPMLGMNISLNTGVDAGISFGDLDHRVNIELPLLYHRLSVFHNNYGFHTGFDLERNIIGKISALVDLDFSILPGLGTRESDLGLSKLLGKYSLEHKALLIFTRSETFRILTGYKFVHGEYPFGAESRILPFLFLADIWVPMIEFQWGGSFK